MPSYKLIASDLDGTLLKKNKTVSKENKKAIAELSQKGVQFALSSGRTLGEIPDHVKGDPNVRYVIHSDGAVIYDKKTNTRMEECMTGEVNKFVLDTLFSYHSYLTVRYLGESYADELIPTTEESLLTYRLSRDYRDFVRANFNFSNDFKNFCYGMEQIEMICVFFADDEEMAECRRRLSEDPALEISASEPSNLEIYSCKAGKGKALLRLAEALHIPQSETIAMGDSPNDMEMVKMAGLGLAMENATDELKAVADAVICNNEQHAVVYVKEHYFD